MAKGFVEIETLAALQRHLQAMPEGTTCDILPSDLEAGNFDIAHFVLPSGLEGDVKYIGPVAEGYVSPFETQDEDEMLDTLDRIRHQSVPTPPIEL